MARRGVLPAITLFLLAPVCGELLSGSAPPAEFFHPFGFITLTILYGFGALLIREMTVRWGGGWRSVLLLGAAYGIVEEGLITVSFFNPGWYDLGVMAVYGRAGGVNWLWVVYLILFHMVVSIGIPILITHALFPARQRAPWLGRAGLWIAALVWLGNAVVLTLMFTVGADYLPPPLPYTLTIAVVLALAWLARRTLDAPPSTSRSAAPLWYGVVGFVWVLGHFVLGSALPALNVPWPLGVVVLAGWAALAAVIILRVLGAGVIIHMRAGYALAVGVMSMFLLFAPISENDATRPDNTAGMTLVALVMVVFFVLAGRRIWRRTTAS